MHSVFDNPAVEAIFGPTDAQIFTAIRPHFDQAFYCDRYRDINTDQVDPLEHYCVYGWKEGRDPCAWFSTQRYLQRNSDVAESGFNPFLHYILVGKKEGRRIWRADHHGAFDLDVDPGSTLVADPDLRDLIKFQPRVLRPPAEALRTDCLRIHWVVPDFTVGSGGHMTIFRLIRWLEIAGHDCSIWITNSCCHRTEAAAYEDIIRHFQTIRAPVAFAVDGLEEAEGDAIIATGWQTVARVLNATGFRRRFYLVQDYEPSFHPVGSHALAALWTYTQDLDCICASPWLARILGEKHGRPVSHFWLAYDKEIYYPPPRSDDKLAAENNEHTAGRVPRIALYARRTSPRRVVEFALLALEYLAAKGVRFHVELFGDEILETVAPFPCSSHGVLGAGGLAALYRKAQVGICFSATNYSLVPQEMMACGLPVIEIDGESTRAVFPEDVVTLTGPHPCEIADGILALLRDPERRQTQAEAALRWVEQFDWEKSAKSVEGALLERLVPASNQRRAGYGPAVPSRKPDAGQSRRFAWSPKASVCIPTYNGGELVTEVIERVRSQRAPWPFEIIIVDSSSTDGSIERLARPAAGCLGSRHKPDLRLERIPKAEFQHGRTRNLCARLARGEFVAFLTQDALPCDEFWLYNLVTVLERFPAAAGAFGRHLPYPGADPFTKRDIIRHFDDLLQHPLIMSRGTLLSGNDGDTETARQVRHFFSNNNACLRKSVWNLVPFPEIDYGEDQVWADKIIRLGYEKIHVPGAAVYHSHDYTPAEVAVRAETEAFFFVTMFGYAMHDFNRAFQEQLAAACDADTLWAGANGVSEEHLAQRQVRNKARLYGHVQGIQRAACGERRLPPVRVAKGTPAFASAEG